MRDAPEENAANGASSALDTDNQSSVEVLSDLIDRLGY
jgi:hypothetical protein